MKRINRVFVLLVCIAAFTAFALGSGSPSTSGSYNTTTDSADNSSITSEATPTPTPDLIVTTTDFKNMKVGDIGKVDDVYVGLSYVKKMDQLTTALGEADFKEGYEVIVAFFDFYNCSDSIKNVSLDDITCYADGIQVEDVETYIKVQVDGIGQFYYVDLDAGTQMISCQDFEVPRGWTELKFFYKSKCIWTVKSDEVKTEDYKFSSVYKIDNSRSVTEIGTVLNSGQRRIEYKGFEVYHTDNILFGDEAYAVFKYTLTNSSDEAWDTSLIGYDMRAYQNNYLVDDATYTLDDKIDGFINIYNVDRIETGMSANIYIAFQVEDVDSSLYMIYDAGYITSDIKGTVYADYKK